MPNLLLSLLRAKKFFTRKTYLNCKQNLGGKNKAGLLKKENSLLNLFQAIILKKDFVITIKENKPKNMF